MTREQAETIALQALQHIASDADLLDRFMAESGLSPADLRRQAGDPALLAGALDHLLQDEALLLAFCAATELPPELPARARALLPGGGELWS